MQTTKINNHVIRPIYTGGQSVDKRPILGEDLIPHLYCSIFLVAKKNSGKTTVINHILKNCAGPETTVFAFTTTLYNDPQWVQIKKTLDRKNVLFKGYTSLYSDSGENRITKWLSEQSTPIDDFDDSETEKQEQKESNLVVRSNAYLLSSIVSLPTEEAETKSRPKRRKSTHRMPEAIFIFDDFSKELRDPSIAEFIKRHRHYKTKVIISSQYVKDIVPGTAQNIDIWLLFKGLSNEFLSRVYELSNPSVDFEKYKEMYNDATSQDYGFLYSDTTAKAEFRKQFNKRYSNV